MWIVIAHAKLKSREHWPPEEDQQWRRGVIGDSAIREGGAGVAVNSDGRVRWAPCPVADGLDSSHCSIDEADVNPEIASTG